MPAEWAPHAATWLAWPHKRSDWPGKIEAIPWVVAEIVRHLTTGERVRILVPDGRREREARTVLGRAGVRLASVDLVRGRSDRFWTRDSLPTVVRHPGDGSRALVQWRFNAWAKYDDFHYDAALGRVVATHLGLPRWIVRHGSRHVVLEGGAFDVDGRGTLLTTEECLLSSVQARNPSLKRRDYERLFAAQLGVTRVVWLDRGIAGDDTHGHVDDLARFVGPAQVVVASTPDRDHEDYWALRDAHERLSRATDATGRRLRVARLPMPTPVTFGGRRLPASYANFYVGNAVVLVPTFNDPADRVALTTLARLFPTRRVVGIHAVDLVLGLGTIHCMTQQEPA